MEDKLKSTITPPEELEDFHLKFIKVTSLSLNFGINLS
jgi:hypothetical protein